MAIDRGIVKEKEYTPSWQIEECDLCHNEYGLFDIIFTGVQFLCGDCVFGGINNNDIKYDNTHIIKKI